MGFIDACAETLPVFAWYPLNRTVKNPFVTPPYEREEAADLATLTAPYLVFDFLRCCRLAINVRNSGFMDPSPHSCMEDTLSDASAYWFRDDASVKTYKDRKFQKYDLASLPWESKPEFKEYLKRQWRLPEQGHVVGKGGADFSVEDGKEH